MAKTLLRVLWDMGRLDTGGIAVAGVKACGEEWRRIRLEVPARGGVRFEYYSGTTGGH